MSEEKETIFLRVSPELKRAVKIAATLEHRKMANFVEAVLFANPKVKEALEQGLEQEESKNSENNAKEEKESLKQEKGKKSVQKTEKKKEEQEVSLERMKHSF